jgi:WD40 repeat protein
MDNARASENPILVYSISNGELLHTLKGHVGGVWVLAVYKSTLVSGSTDSEVGIWDLSIGICTHFFTALSIYALTLLF